MGPSKQKTVKIFQEIFQTRPLNPVEALIKKAEKKMEWPVIIDK